VADMTREHAHATLDGVAQALADKFPGRLSEDRLTQIQFHLDTAGMAVDHLFEEEERRQAEKAERIARIQADEEA
jgi:hypothetical protein